MGTDLQDLVATIERAFAVLGSPDQPRREDVFCEDFHAFENGVSMTGAELFELMRAAHAQGRRYRWSVESPRVEAEGKLALVRYVNRGAITERPGADPMPMAWLESVLLRRRASGWRIAFLHSTRMPQSGS